MSPVEFPQANCRFGPPGDLEESQCSTIHAYQGTIERGSCEGAPLVITAWKPTPEELEVLNAGGAVFLSFIGGLPPHFATTSFEQASAPA